MFNTFKNFLLRNHIIVGTIICYMVDTYTVIHHTPPFF